MVRVARVWLQNKAVISFDATNHCWAGDWLQILDVVAMRHVRISTGKRYGLLSFR